jgi:hypothetical protein
MFIFSYQIGQSDTKGNDNYKSKNEHLQTILKKIPIVFVITMKIALPNANAFSHITFRNTNLWSPDTCRQTTIK